MIDWSTSVLLVSGFDDEGSGGLFTFDGSELGQIDSLSSVGLVVQGARVGRLLRAPVDVDSATELVVYDRTGVLEYRRIDEVVDPHDLAVFDGRWIIVSSGANSVTSLAPDGAADVMWQPSTVPDSWHPNCVAVVDGRVWVTAFGHFDDRRGWSGDVSFGAGFLRNLATGEEIGGLSHPHSPRWSAGTWTVCNSLEGTVVTWDPDAARRNPPRRVGAVSAWPGRGRPDALRGGECQSGGSGPAGLPRRRPGRPGRRPGPPAVP